MKTLLEKLTPEALAQLDKEAINFPATVERLKKELNQYHHFLELSMCQVMALIRATNTDLNVVLISKLFI